MSDLVANGNRVITEREMAFGRDLCFVMQNFIVYASFSARFMTDSA